MFALLASALFTTATPTHAMPGPDIVIIGQRIDDARARLAACLARRCAPNEDVDATLALAEAQLIDGGYDEARESLLASLRRNKRAGPRYAMSVSDLYRANGRVAAHLGLDSDYYRSAYASYEVLKRATEAGDYRRFMARIEIAEMLGETHGHEWARNYYEGIAKDARKAGRPDIAALAELRSLMRHYPDGELRTRGIERIAALKDPPFRAAALEAKLALARVAFEKHDEAAAAALLNDLAALKIRNPILVHAPPIELRQFELPNGDFFDVNLAGAPGTGPAVTSNLPTSRWSTINRLSERFDDMWIDVAFRIGTDGRVRDVKVGRSRGDRSWAKPLLESIRGRRYTPAAEGSPQALRKERYTYTAAYQKQSGTHMVGRSPKARIEYLDLTARGLTRDN